MPIEGTLNQNDLYCKARSFLSVCRGYVVSTENSITQVKKKRDLYHCLQRRISHAISTHAGYSWLPENVPDCQRLEITWIAYFMIEYCHLGNSYIPREDHIVDCPLCGEFSTWDPFTSECAALDHLQSQLLGSSPWGSVGFQGLVWHECFRLGRFLIESQCFYLPWRILMRDRILDGFDVFPHGKMGLSP